MRRGTTPTITINVDADLSGYDEVYLTLASRSATVERSKEQLGIVASEAGCTMEVSLTQAETLRFRAGDTASAQIRAKSGDSAIATDIATVPIAGILKDGAI